QRTTDHALRLRLDDVVLVAGPGNIVALLDQQPLLLVAAAGQAGPHQRPIACQLLADQGELELARRIARRRVALRLPDALIPDDHVSGTVAALGDAALEAGVIQRVIFDVHGQALVARVQARTLGYRPALQRAVQLQTEVV